MSSVILQIGQCGNQIGHEFWKILELDPNAALPYYSNDGKFRSVNIDCEPKVIHKLANDPMLGRAYRHSNLVASRRGCGSNWALGYHGNRKSQGGNSVLDKSLEAVRKEVEKCASFSGFICMHSLAGGTGSGLGSLLAENLRDLYPMNHLLSCVVAPFGSGEITVQDYNMLLTLSALQKNSDGILVFRNDDVLQHLDHCKSNSDSAKSISMSQINRHVAVCLSELFLPTDSQVRGKQFASIGKEPWELLRSLCPQPNLKCLNVCRSSSKKTSWSDLASFHHFNHRIAERGGCQCTNLSTVIVARGSDASSFAAYLKKVEDRIKSVTWNPFPLDFWAQNSGHFNGGSPSITVAANCSYVIPLLERTVSRARAKYDAGAYLHWYKRYGCEEGDFNDCFEQLATIVADYEEAIA